MEEGWVPKEIPFTATPGPRGAAADIQSDDPVDFVELYLTDELLLSIIAQTNANAEDDMMAEIAREHETGIAHPHARIGAWKDLTLGELKNFFGLLFLTAIVHKPEIEMHWSLNPVIATPYFGRTMSRNRFQII